MNRAMPAITESADELKVLLKQETNVKRAQRLQMLYLVASKQARTRKEVASLLGVHRETVGDWLALYVEGGREALLELYVAPGKEPSVTPEIEAQLREELEKPTGFASYGAIVEWLWQQHGIRLAYSTVHTLVRYKLEARPKVARRSNREKNPTPSKPSRPRSLNA
jgi:transposase